MAEIQSKMQLRIINNIPPSQCTKDYNRLSITSKGQYSYRYYKITIRVTYNHSHLHPPSFPPPSNFEKRMTRKYKHFSAFQVWCSKTSISVNPIIFHRNLALSNTTAPQIWIFHGKSVRWYLWKLAICKFHSEIILSKKLKCHKRKILHKNLPKFRKGCTDAWFE